MKKYYLLIAAASLLFVGSCGSSPGENSNLNSAGTQVKGPGSEVSETSDGESAAGITEDHGTKMLTGEDFLVKVMNYEKNPTEWVFEGNKPCLIDFYADWCAPCRITSPILEELAKEYGSKIDIYKIDTDKEKELAAVFGIQSIPSFLFVPMEGKPTMSSGIARTPEETRQMFRDQIDKILLQKDI
jgi:thioredoxin